MTDFATEYQRVKDNIELSYVKAGIKGATNIAKLTSQEISIATNKNWVIN